MGKTKINNKQQVVHFLRMDLEDDYDFNEFLERSGKKTQTYWKKKLKEQEDNV